MAAAVKEESVQSGIKLRSD